MPPINYDQYLRASNGNGEAVRANVVTEREVGGNEINVDSVINWPSKFVATSGAIDPTTNTFDPNTVTVFWGHLNGTYLVIDEFAAGYSDIGNQPNEVVVIKPTTPWADLFAEMFETVGGARTHIYDIQSSVYYLGTAPVGALTSQPIWDVRKIDWTTNPYTSKIAINISWDDRTEAIYE